MPRSRSPKKATRTRSCLLLCPCSSKLAAAGGASRLGVLFIGCGRPQRHVRRRARGGERAELASLGAKSWRCPPNAAICEARSSSHEEHSPPCCATTPSRGAPAPPRVAPAARPGARAAPSGPACLGLHARAGAPSTVRRAAVRAQNGFGLRRAAWALRRRRPMIWDHHARDVTPPRAAAECAA